MKTYILSAFLLLPFIGFSQDCEVKVDPFTKEKTVSFDFMKKAIYFEKKSSQMTLEMIFNFTGQMNKPIPKGSSVFFKFENEQTLELKTIRDSNPNSRLHANQYTAGVTTNYSLVFDISKEDLQKMNSSLTVLIRYPNANGTHVDYELKKGGKKYAKALMEGANCMFNNL